MNGHWLWRNPNMAICSNCGYEITIDNLYGFQLELNCPKCGKSMVKDTELILEDAWKEMQKGEEKIN